MLFRTEHGWLLTGIFGGDQESRAPPFDAVAIDIGILWGLAPMTPPAP
jgi:hypothetical protein